jgi:hypothetical protein
MVKIAVSESERYQALLDEIESQIETISLDPSVSKKSLARLYAMKAYYEERLGFRPTANPAKKKKHRKG